MANDPSREVLLSNTDEDDRPEFLLTDASLLSHISFACAYPTLKLGSVKALEDHDLPKLHRLETSAFNRDNIEEMWKNEKCTDEFGMGSNLRIFPKHVTRCAVSDFINMMARMSRPGLYDF